MSAAQNYRTPLSDKQMLFVEAYAGDPQEAAQLAGYAGEPYRLRQVGESMLKDPKIIEAINMRSQLQNKVDNTVADRTERQKFWTSIMRNEDPHAKPEVDKSGMTMPPPSNVPLAMRLKASEMLGKSEADFMDRIEHTGNISITDVITQAYEVPFKEIETQMPTQAAAIPHNPQLTSYQAFTPAPEPEPAEPALDIEDLI